MTSEQREINEKADLRSYQLSCIIDLIRSINAESMPQAETLHGVSTVMDEFLTDIRIAIDYQYNHE